ncbi:hypothetical protein [Halococcus thailandensis]|nr:hypothetical protein [Halococcus thailandensis]
MAEPAHDSGRESWIDRHRLVVFLLITYAFTWVIQGFVAASGMEAS